MAYTNDAKESTLSATQETLVQDDERGGRKRSRSPSTPPPSQQRKSQRTELSPNSPLLHRSSRSPRPSPGQKSRRRSEHTVDETFRGRTRQRSLSKRRQSSAISEEEDDTELDPPSRDPHKRHPSPSRGPINATTASPPFRRRRSLPNHYERIHQTAGCSDDRNHFATDEGDSLDWDETTFQDTEKGKRSKSHIEESSMDLDGTQDKSSDDSSGDDGKHR